MLAVIVLDGIVFDHTFFCDMQSGREHEGQRCIP